MSPSVAERSLAATPPETPEAAMLEDEFVALRELPTTLGPDSRVQNRVPEGDAAEVRVDRAACTMEEWRRSPSEGTKLNSPGVCVLWLSSSSSAGPVARVTAQHPLEFVRGQGAAEAAA